jgi:hypothetical protein
MNGKPKSGFSTISLGRLQCFRRDSADPTDRRRRRRKRKEREVTIIYKYKPFASRPIGRPKNRWEDDVRKGLQTVKVRNWK